jgi:mannosyl-oligosaccharide alpha-1,2-mannosidase
VQQFLLLGGLQDQYRKMYLKTIEDIKKWMIYRPMIPGNRDILFSGSVMTKGDPINDLELIPEVEHLTCFISGMIGMSAKIFKLEGDLELAKKLADGCVWAYESTPHGIMPEGSIMVPCKDKEQCTWNETVYYHELDPIWDSRDQNVADYIKSKKEVDAQLAADAKAAAAKKEAERINALNSDVDADEDLEDISPRGNGTAALKKDGPVSLQKRQTESSPKLEVPKPITHNFKDGSTDGKKPSANTKTTKIAPKPGSSTKIPSPADKFYEHKADLTEADLRNIATGGRLDDFPPDEVIPAPMRDPSMPFTHKEFVETRIKQETLPPGFTHIKSRKYILRYHSPPIPFPLIPPN